MSIELKRHRVRFAATVLLLIAGAVGLQLGFVNCSGFSPVTVASIEKQGVDEGSIPDDGNTNPPQVGSTPIPATPTPRPGNPSNPNPTPTPTPTPTSTPGPIVQKPTIRYIGRFDHSDPAGPRFAWSGSAIEAAFIGTSVTMKMKSPGENYFTIVIDGGQPSVVRVDSGTRDYTLASNLSNSKHVVKIWRNTEASLGVTQLLGLNFGTGGRSAELDVPNRLRMEVIGDSITCGYGNTGPNATCPFTSATENNYLAYGSVAARLLNADLSTVSISGRGVYHNYGGQPNNPNDPTMGFYYPYTLPPVSNPGGTFMFDFSKQEPMDVVVINLGTNDLSLNPPDAATLAAAYKNFVSLVRSKNREAHLVFAIGTMIAGNSLNTWRTAVQTVINQMKQAGDNKVSMVEFPAQDGQRGIGCDYHPSAAQHDLMGNMLAKSIKDSLGL